LLLPFSLCYNSGMTTLVTGATGLIGANLTRLLVERGETVRVLVRPDQKRRQFALEEMPVETVPGDVIDLASVRAAMSGCQKVYHVAGQLGMGSGQWKLFRRVNIEGTANICRAALECGVERLVHTSTVSSVGWSVDGHPVDETTPWNFAAYPTPYTCTKRDGEAIVLEYVQHGLPAVIVNPAYCLGPWDSKPSSGILLQLAATGLVIGVPGGGANVAEAREVARGHILAMERGRIGQRYILGGENVSWWQFFTLLARRLGKQPPRFIVPAWLAIWGGILLDIPGRLGIRMPISANGMRILYRNHYVSSQKAVTELGYCPSQAGAAIESAIPWMQQHGYLRAALKSQFL
jgi:dihydroflavonol-4-reductase